MTLSILEVQDSSFGSCPLFMCLKIPLRGRGKDFELKFLAFDIQEQSRKFGPSPTPILETKRKSYFNVKLIALS